MNKLYRQAPSRDQLKQLLEVARGDKPADIVISNVKILDLVNGDSYQSNIAIVGSWIAGINNEYQGKTVIDGSGLWAVPGFIDAHTHLESSLLHPFEFSRTTLPKGTTTAICDPHEITNVLGRQGIEWILRCAERSPQTLLIQVPSCIPSLPGFETNGGILTPQDMEELKDHPNVFGMGEMMNIGGVIHGDDKVLDIIDNFSDIALDGHAPMLRGKALNAYCCAGIQNCHESVSTDEALEKLRVGMAVMLREGSVAKNITGLASIINEFNSIQCLLATDDRNPYEIIHEGHIDHLIRLLITTHKIPAHIAYRLSSYSPAQHYKLKRRGLIAPGYRADIVLLDNLEAVKINRVICGGKVVNDNLMKDTQSLFNQSHPPLHNSINCLPVTTTDFKLSMDAGDYNVIGIIANEIITEHLVIGHDGINFYDEGINKIAVIERYGHGLPPAIAHVSGFDLKQGAIASSVAHDCHNIIVIGANEADMAFAVQYLQSIGGGFAAVNHGQVLASLALPIAGLMSTDPADIIAEKLTQLKQACLSLGCPLHEPFLQMAFLALPVIPALKITDKGLIDTKSQKFLPYKTNDTKIQN